METKTKIFFIIPSLHGGGSERVFSHILKNINQNKFDASLVLVKKEGVYLNSIPETICIYDLDSSHTRKVPLKLLKLIWNHKPDVVFSTLGHMNLIIALFRFLMPKNTRFIARESSTVSVHNKNEKYPRLFDLLFKTVYRSFDKVVCQSFYMQKDLVSNYQMAEHKTVVINNPVDFDLIEKNIDFVKSPFDPDKINFLAVGRLSKEKGFKRLIDVFKLLSDERIHLTIIGDGEDRGILTAYIKDLGLQGRVTLLGFIKNPYSYMYHAKALLMSSHYEGFPNVVIEANACGTAVIAFDSPGGIKEIINNGCNGWLIPDGDLPAFAERINRQANEASVPRADIIRGTKENFAMSVIMHQYEQLFAALKGKRGENRS